MNTVLLTRWFIVADNVIIVFGNELFESLQ